MAITVQKKNITLKVVTLGGNEFTATDGEKAHGSAAFEDFKHHDVVKILGGESDIYVPYHAIDHVEVTTQTTSEEITDDNCVEEGNDTVEP